MNTMRDARIREQQRLSKDKYTTQDYKQYQKNYGFGRDFLPFENGKFNIYLFLYMEIQKKNDF